MALSKVPEFFTPENPLFATYAFHTGVLCTKMFAVTLLTARQRYKKKVFANSEDVAMKGGKLDLADPDVERVRRAHRNDLENIPAFLFVSFLYILTEPEERTALALFRAFTVARVAHTLVYAVKPLPQPARGLSFGVGLGVTVYMAVKVMRYFCPCSH